MRLFLASVENCAVRGTSQRWKFALHTEIGNVCFFPEIGEGGAAPSPHCACGRPSLALHVLKHAMPQRTSAPCPKPPATAAALGPLSTLPQSQHKLERTMKCK